MIIKILSYNIHKGYDWNKRNYFIKDIKMLIEDSNADIVFLQEVVGKSNFFLRDGQVESQFEFLADSIWKHYSYAANSIYNGGHHGNLILSKFDLLSWENVDITTNQFEKRGLLICKIRIPEINQDIICAGCVHLDLLHRGRQLQYEMIKNKILSMNFQKTLPLVIAGDFNDWNQKSHNIFEKDLGMLEAYKLIHGRFAKTYPARYPLLCLDRIYVKNIKVLNAHVWKTPVKTGKNYHFSDHLPIFCELEILRTEIEN